MGLPTHNLLLRWRRTELFWGVIGKKKKNPSRINILLNVIEASKSQIQLHEIIRQPSIRHLKAVPGLVLRCRVASSLPHQKEKKKENSRIQNFIYTK